MASRRRGRQLRVREYVRSVVLKNVPDTNTYSCLVRGLVDATLLDLRHELRLHDDPRREGRRRPVEELFNIYSREVSIALSELLGAGRGVEERLKEASAWVEEVYSAACSLFDAVFLFNIETLTRLLIHTKSPYMPLEIGLAWHPILDLPYIPATALKGAARAYFEERRVSVCGLGPDELFGSVNQRGVLVFFDAVPVRSSGPILEPDALTPHYPEVEGRLHETSVRPRPLVFLTVPTGVRFSAVVAADTSSKLNLACLASELPEKLSEALSRGVGARVSVGYGYVRVTLMSAKTGGVVE